eukprot:6213691-Pleurochrysis_carterae.AAC.1
MGEVGHETAAVAQRVAARARKSGWFLWRKREGGRSCGALECMESNTGAGRNWEEIETTVRQAERVEESRRLRARNKARAKSERERGRERGRGRKE